MSSCLIAKLSHYIDLSSDDCRLLERLEKNEREYSAGTDVHTIGMEVSHMHVVKSGWLYNYLDLPDGRRQIVRIHHPGDVLGLPDIAYNDASSTLRASTDACLCPFPKSHMDEIFVNAPRLTALLFTIAVRDQVVLIDMLRATGRMSARERVSYLLLDLLARLRVTNKEITDSFKLPLNQSEIGDTVGLTNVYVSKTLKQLQSDGYISLDNTQVRLLNEDAMIEMCDFAERYASIDTSWFPA